MNILIVGGSGYCGSFLARRLRDAGRRVTRLDKAPGSDFHMDYAAFGLYPISLFEADVVLWFAGKSSVAQAEAVPIAALADNCLNLVALRRTMRPDAYLLYASSASVYSTPRTPWKEEGKPPMSREDAIVAPSLNAYDRSKFAADYLLAQFPSTLGLRMGTVCGWSPTAMRTDTVFNAMNLSAVRDGIVAVGDPTAWRSVLFLDDLAAVVEACLHDRPTGILNAATENITIGSLAADVAEVHDAKLAMREQPPSPYSFRMDMTRMHKIVGTRRRVDFHAECMKFKEATS